jgi:serine/threonine protein kinase/tetratricopeptide (TPR) repeat protein
MNPAAGADATTNYADQLLADLVDQYTARLQAGEAVDVESFARAHPAHSAELRRLLPALQALADLESSARPAADPAPPAPASPDPGILGDFRILREVGRGGMGIVYEAEQLSLRRRVALKVLPFAAALDARQLQRFQTEARAAAHLHHTNIVPVYAVGCDRGVHYYAMQFIDGRTLAEAIDELRSFNEPTTGAEARSPQPVPGAGAPATAAAGALTTERSARTPGYFRAVAQLGVQAAEALEHAHEQGIVHRDVKPANLLVDARGHLWVADFGLARCQSEAGLTATGDLVGTLRYMSPEQALAQRVVIDHRTDIYSLGATLYELLTLRHIFTGEDRQELLRQIAFEEPRAPRRLDRAIPVELETIVLKAAAKSPADRYQTAQELADDLRRFLEDRPIHARRPTLGQRLGRWARRHRQLVGAATVALVLAVIGLGVSNLLIWQERDRTEQQRRLAVAKAEEAQQREKEAEKNFRMAEKVVQDYFTLVSESRELKAHGLEQLRKQLLGGARAYYHKFVAMRRGDPRLRAELGDAYYRLATITAEVESRARASALFEKALATAEELSREHPDHPEHRYQVGASLCELGNLHQLAGRLEKARELRNRSLEVYQKLVVDFPSKHVFRWELAGAHQNLGTLDHVTGRLRVAERSYQRALNLRTQLVREHTDEPRYRRSLAESYMALGGFYRTRGERERAETALGKARRTWEELTRMPYPLPGFRHMLGMTHYQLAVLHTDMGRWEQAEKALQTALGILQPLASAHPSMLDYQDDLATVHSQLASLYRTDGRTSEARAAEERALSVREQLVRAAPDDPAYRMRLAESYQNTAQRDQAGDAAARAVAIHERLVREHPESPQFRHNLAHSYHRQGDLHAATGQLAEAARSYEKALAIEEKLAKDQPLVSGYRSDLGATCLELGRQYANSGQPDRAEPFQQRALAIAEPLARDHPDHILYRVNLAQCYNELGLLYHNTGRPDQARATWDKALAIRQQLVREHPRDPRYRGDLAQSHYNHTLVLWRTSPPDRTEASYRAALEIQEELLREQPKVAHYRRRLALTYNGLSVFLYRRLRRLDEAEKTFSRSLELREQLARDRPNVLEYRSDLGASYNNIANFYMDRQRPEAAEAMYRKALEVRQQLVDDHPDRPQFAVDLALTLGNLGSFWGNNRNEPEQALDWYGKGVPLLGAVLRKEPRHAEARGMLARFHAARGELLEQLDRGAECLPEWREALRLMEDSPLRRRIKVAELRALAQTSDYEEAAAETAALAEQPGSDASLWADLAQVRALCARAAAEDMRLGVEMRAWLADEYAAQTVALLSRVLATGGFQSRATRDWLRSTAGFDAVRNYPGFARILARLPRDDAKETP